MASKFILTQGIGFSPGSIKFIPTLGFNIATVSTVVPATLEEKIFSLLTTSTTITGTIGDRLFPVRAPQAVKMPYGVYQRISGGQQNGLSGYLTLENPRIQIDVYSTSYSQVKTLAGNIHTQMETSTGFKNTLISDSDLFEDELNVYRITMDYSCWHRA